MKIQLIKSKFNHGMNNDRIFHIDNFWDDCIKEEQKLNNPLFKISQEEYSQAYISNNNSINKYYKKLCDKIPNLNNNEKKNLTNKAKIKNSLKKSLFLYKSGLEYKKTIETNYLKNKLMKENEELKLCTWKPKISKNNTSKKELNNNIIIKKFIQRNKSKKKENSNNCSKKIMDEANYIECTFKPKICSHSKKTLKKVFNRSNSMPLYTDRGNTSFMMRYKKARDEHMIKRFKKLYVKDESYRNSFIEMTYRECEKHYKNYLNVNNNIDLYDIALKANYNKNKYIFNLSAGNNSTVHSERASNNQQLFKKKNRQYYMGILKKQLSLVNLEAL